GIRDFHVTGVQTCALPIYILTIADAKRGDIGNTSKYYADAVFDIFGFDSITVHPYMGEDSVKPFLLYEDKLIFILALTSNPGARSEERRVGKECRSRWW